MRKVTGRIPLLPIAEQKRLYDRLERAYKNLERLEAEGKNTLEAKTLELDAKPLETIEAEPADRPERVPGWRRTSRPTM
jgi:hypothetical protein